MSSRRLFFRNLTSPERRGCTPEYAPIMQRTIANMLLVLIFATIFTTPTMAASEDIYEEPLFFMDARSPRLHKLSELSDPRDSSDSFLRFGRNSDIFIPLRGSFDMMDARPTRAQEKNDNFVRFGRSRSDFVRFGRDRGDKEAIEARLLRVGRSLEVRPGGRVRRDVYQSEKRDRENFMRFGRGGDDSFMRLGRNPMGGVLEQSDELKGGQSAYAKGRFAHSHFPLNGQLLHLTLLDLLRKLQDAQAKDN